MLLWNISNLSKIYMSRWGTVEPNELCFELLISNKDLSTDAVNYLFLRSPATQTKEAPRLFHSERVVIVFRDFGFINRF